MTGIIRHYILLAALGHMLVGHVASFFGHLAFIPCIFNLHLECLFRRIVRNTKENANQVELSPEK